MLNFLYTGVSWVLLRWHDFFSLFINKDSGLNWTLSIVFLVVTARLLLFRLFIKQVHYQRHMQVMQPKIQELRKKYSDDKAEMQRQMMKLQQEQGFNPLSGCLPMFLQFPIFIGLYHVLRHLSNSVGRAPGDSRNSLYSFTQAETFSAAKARLFGAPLAGRLTDSPAQIAKLLGNVDTTRIVVVVLVLISAAATFTTQLLVRRGVQTVPEGTAATVQRLMLWGIPLSTLGSGLFFPLGVLLYWFTSNTWTMAQQLYVNKYHPHTPKDAPELGALGKTLAPRPGAKPNPVRGTGRPSTAQTTPQTGDAAASSPGAGDASPATRPGDGPARPGQRSNRPATKRPAAKRPSQAKKRR